MDAQNLFLPTVAKPGQREVKKNPLNMSPGAPSCSGMPRVKMAADMTKTRVILCGLVSLGARRGTPAGHRSALELAREGERVVALLDVGSETRQRLEGEQRKEYAHDDLAQRTCDVSILRPLTRERSIRSRSPGCTKIRRPVCDSRRKQSRTMNQ